MAVNASAIDRAFYRRMALHELEQARRYAQSDTERTVRALKRCRLWRNRSQAARKSDRH